MPMAKISPRARTIVSRKPKPKWPLHLCVGVGFLAAVGAVFWVCQQYVAQDLTLSDHPPQIVIANRPVWMSDYLANEIVKSAQPIGAHSVFDEQLLFGTAK